MSSKGKRITIKPKRPNPLFEEWLIQWRDNAKENGSKMEYCFSNALKTLRQYPLPLERGRDCKILKGFGEKLCQMLDEKLSEYKARNCDGAPVKKKANLETSTPTIASRAKKASPGKRTEKTTPKEYIPQAGSGSYAILVTLYDQSQELNYPGFLLKSEIIAKGKHLSNTSFTKPGPDTRYTAWSSMASLLQKNLVKKEGNPAKFSLTPEGSILGEKLYIQQKVDEFQRLENEEKSLGSKQFDSGNTGPLVNDVFCKSDNLSSSGVGNTGPSIANSKKTALWRTTSTNSTSSQASTASNLPSVVLAPQTFDIVLLVDNRELSGNENDIFDGLERLSVAYEVRNLTIGDYVWICRNSTTELVLPYIIERKRMDDLGHSIKDKRFYEQKFRLKQSGLPNVIYLIENHGRNQHVGLPINSLLQAAVNTLLQDNFIVKFTDNPRETCEYLASLSRFFNKIFKIKTIASCDKADLQSFEINDDLIGLMHFQEFHKASSKTKPFKVHDMFVKQLLQIKGMSIDKALAIVNTYSTPRTLKAAYTEEDNVKNEKLLANVRYGTLNKNVGPILSKTVYQFFCKKHYT